MSLGKRVSQEGSERVHEYAATLYKDLDELSRKAVEFGATETKIIPASSVVFDERAILKCLVPPCECYGTNLQCPPYLAVKPSVMRRCLKRYSHGILVRLAVPVEDFADPDAMKSGRTVPSTVKLHEIVSRVEGLAFYKGYYFAVGLKGGPCMLCGTKTADRVICPGLQNGGICKVPLRARPAMEAVGIDVFATIRNAGWKIYPIGAKTDPRTVPCASRIGLVLVT